MTTIKKAAPRIFRLGIALTAWGLLIGRLPAADPAPSSSDPVRNAAAADALLGATPRLRGFTVPHTADEAVLQAVRDDYGANVVRLMLRPIFDDPADPIGQWKKELALLPAQMEAARRHHVFAVVCLFDPPIPGFQALRAQGKNAWQHYLWKEPGMLEEMKQQAVETAKALEPYKGGAWLELMNEPLDWDDMPSYPQNWPQWAQAIVNAVRGVSDIPLVVEAGPGSLCRGYQTFPVLTGGGIVYSLHNYQPQAYTHQGVKTLTATDLAHTFEKTAQPWPGTFSDGGNIYWDKARLRQELAPAIEFAKKNGIRMYVGEFGVARWAPNADQYLRDNIELFEEMGWDWTCHAFRESPIWSPEYEDAYRPDPALATEPTPRARVLKEFLARNVAP